MKIDLQLPGSWQAVTANQLLVIGELLGKELCREEFLLVLFCRLSGLKMIAAKEPDGNRLIVATRFKYGEIEFSLEDWQVREFCNNLAFVLDEMPVDIVCPVNVDRHLMGTSFGDYFHADAMMLLYTQTNDIGDIQKALKDLGDPHEKLTEAEAAAVRTWWTGFKEWLKGQYPLVFDGGNDDENDGYSPIQARQNILLMLNEGHPQDNEQIEKANVHDVLAALQHKIEEAKHIEEQMNKYKR